MFRLAYVVMLLLVSSAATAQEAGRSFAGCYSLTLTAWEPPITGGDLPFHDPPPLFRLFDESAAARGIPFRRAEPPIVHAYSRGYERASWLSIDSIGFRVIWSDGLNGADLRLSVVGDSLTGTVQVLTDAMLPNRPIPQASAVARRIPCR